LGLVVPGGVEGELADEFAGVVEDSDVSSGDEHGDGLAGVASSDADVVEASGVADGEFAVAVDGVVSEAVAVDGVGWWVWVGFGACGEHLEGCAPVERAMRADGVVVVDEAFELALQRWDAAGGSLFGEEPFEGLVEAFDPCRRSGGDRASSV
jgi:hypothetical protein